MNALIAENQAQQQALFNQLSEKARQEGFALEMSKMGVSLVPILNGKPISAEQFEALEDETKQEMEKRRTALQSDINNFLREVREVNKASREKVNELNRRVGLYVVGVRVEEIKEQYSDIPQVVSYLDDVQDYMLSHLEDFSEKSQEPDASPAAQLKLEISGGTLPQVQGEHRRRQHRHQGRSGHHRNQSHLLQPLRPRRTPRTARDLFHRLHDGPRRLLRQGQRRIPGRHRAGCPDERRCLGDAQAHDPQQGGPHGRPRRAVWARPRRRRCVPAPFP